MELHSNLTMKIRILFTAALLIGSLPAVASAEHHDARPIQDIVDTAVAAGSFNTLAAALNAADLVGVLRGEGPFTVFAPTDEAFAKLPAGTIDTLLKPENKAQLTEILTYHVVGAEVPAAAALTLDEAEALNGVTIALTRRDGRLFLNESEVIKTDIKTSNGIIHVIDAVLIPPALAASRGPVDPVVAQLASKAIEMGAPLFNQGNHAACAAVYEMAAEAMMLMPGGTMTAGNEKMLQAAMQQVRRSHSPTENAWTLRRAFDTMMGSAM